jgi:phosphatidylglycerophosphate synthase
MYYYVSEKGLLALREYRYSGVDNCLTTKVLSGYWEWLVAHAVPLWVAPNVLTLLGGACVVAAWLLCAVRSPTLNSALPPWLLVLVCVLVFAYQSLDAIDGKQARRTRSSSALGELFDHGVDSVVMGLFGPLVASASGTPPLIALAVGLASLLPFYLSHWEHTLTGLMEFGAVGPCEIHFLVILHLLATAALGRPAWHWDEHHAIFFALMLGTIAMSLGIAMMSAMRVVRKLGRDAGLAACFKLAPMAIFAGLSLAWGLVEHKAMAVSPHPFLLAVALVFAYIVQRL